MVYRFIASSDALCLAVCTLGDVLQNYGLLPNQEGGLGHIYSFYCDQDITLEFCIPEKLQNRRVEGPRCVQGFCGKRNEEFSTFFFVDLPNTNTLLPCSGQGEKGQGKWGRLDTDLPRLSLTGF